MARPARGGRMRNAAARRGGRGNGGPSCHAGAPRSMGGFFRYRQVGMSHSPDLIFRDLSSVDLMSTRAQVFIRLARAHATP